MDSLVSSALDKSSSIALIFLDIQKAFDSVNHHLLLNILSQKFSVPGHLCALMLDYLSNRKQSVRVSNSISNPVNVVSGVPQGSVLGPLLFTAFFNSVAELCLNTTTRIILFADDVCLICPLSDQSSVVKMQEDVDKVVNHIQNQLNLSINPLKSKLLQIKRPLCRNPVAPNITINARTVDIVDKQKYLGVIIDSSFNYNSHAINVTSQVKRSLGVFNRRFGKFVPQSVYVYLYVTLFRSILMYAIEVWYPTSNFGRNLLEKTQKYACRLITRNFDHTVSYNALLSRLNLIPLYRFVFVRRLSMIRSFIAGKRHLPQGIMSFLSESGTRASTRLNHAWAVLVPRFRYERPSRSALYLSATAFNCLPFDIVTLPVRKFTRAITCHSLFTSVMDNLDSAKAKIVSIFD